MKLTYLRTDGRTERRTDKPSYKDATMCLKTEEKKTSSDTRNQGCAPKSGHESGRTWTRETQPDVNPEWIPNLKFSWTRIQTRTR